MNLIQSERNNSKLYMLEEIPGTDLVLPSENNVAKVEAMILNDSSYLKSCDPKAGPNNKYGGSTAYWITELRKILIHNMYATDEYYRIILKGTISAIDRDNSTHLNSDGVGIEEITERIFSIGREKLIEYLKKPKETEFWLINEISRKTTPKDNDHDSRRNPSFASKFCHYACFYLFEGQEEQDNYSIWDTVLRKVLPGYIDFYGIENYSFDTYADYQKAIDNVISKSCARISRNGFDHLIWYYYKNKV